MGMRFEKLKKNNFPTNRPIPEKQGRVSTPDRRQKRTQQGNQRTLRKGGGGGGGSTLYEIYIGFCPHIDFHNIIHIDCLTYDYSICDIVFLLPIYMVKK